MTNREGNIIRTMRDIETTEYRLARAEDGSNLHIKLTSDLAKLNKILVKLTTES